METTRNDFESKLITRAWEDEAFRADLLADPTATIKRELEALGIDVPDGVTVVVHEETPQHVHLVLPAKPAAAPEAELTDADLDLVAGGGNTVDKKGNVGCS